jgi:hypothetical protein
MNYVHIGVYLSGQARYDVMLVAQFIVFKLFLLGASKVMPTGHLLN